MDVWHFGTQTGKPDNSCVIESSLFENLEGAAPAVIMEPDEMGDKGTSVRVPLENTNDV